MRQFVTKFVFFAGILTSFSALASAFSVADLPANLECKDKSGRLGTFHVYDLNKGGESLWLDRDARGDSISVGRYVTKFNANNGCDDNFDFWFSTRALVKLARGKSASVHGWLVYFDADSLYDKTNGDGTIRTKIECVAYPEKK